MLSSACPRGFGARFFVAPSGPAGHVAINKVARYIAWMNIALRTLLTVDDYLAWARNQSDPPRSELINGQIVPISPAPMHGRSPIIGARPVALLKRTH